MLSGRLLAEGLFARVAHAHHIWLFWPYELALGGVKLQVLRSELEQAMAVLEQCRLGHYKLLLEAELGTTDEPRCPGCGAARFTSRRSLPQVLLALALYFTLHIAVPLRSCVHRCESCGRRWDDSIRRFFLLRRKAG